ncbi:MAG: ATP-binding cassette domain-containing protein [Ruminococcus sp.]|nr:ATP-binding cassette domain-containing protein [Ruminococcus sp.]
MEAFNIKNLSFSYPESSEKALDNINLTIEQGDFILLCGESGSGKSTLLKMLKPQLTPAGNITGEIIFSGNNLKELSKKESAEKIGFVMQNPDSQIVTDKVYHELSFAMENLAYDKEKIRLKSGEMASFFGLSNVFNNDTNSLSGGQKQLLNLASVLTLQPEVLILDEPTSQLDPLSAENFLNIIKKLNRDFGITVIISEHNLEEVFDFASKVIVLEKGRICSCNTPNKILYELKSNNKNHPMINALPVPIRVYNILNKNFNNKIPLNINEGRKFLQENFKNNIKRFDEEKELIDNSNKKNTVIHLKNVYFRYEKDGSDILKDFNLKVNKGEIYAILGANGSGKSTVVKIISGILKAYHGKVKVAKDENVMYLPQNPQTLFIKDNILDDFELSDNKDKINEVSKMFGIEHLLNKHPYDLSGGEIQKSALAKLMLFNPSVMILDEPTKGIDTFAKNELKSILKNLKKKGVTIIIVTHDTEFACSVSDRCGLLFDGNIIAENSTKEFFGGNGFYTTSANKMSRGFYENAVLIEDIVRLCNLNGEKNAE